eukprot:g2555.t1
MMKTAVLLAFIATAAAANLRVDPVDLAGDKGKNAAFAGKNVSDVSNKPEAAMEANALARATTLTTEVNLPAGVGQNPELKSVVSSVVNQAVKNYQQIVNKNRKPGPLDIIGTAGATGTMGGPNSINVAPVVGPEPQTEMAKALRDVQQKEAVKDIDFASYVATTMQEIEKAKKKCEADYEAAKQKLRDAQAQREADKRWAIGKVTGEGEFGEMQKQMALAKARAEEAIARLLALIKKLQDEFAASKATATDKFSSFIDSFMARIEKEKADWESKKQASMDADKDSGADVIAALTSRLEEMTQKKSGIWTTETEQAEQKKATFAEKWAMKKKELDARIAKLREQIEAIKKALEEFLAGIQKKIATRSKNREKDAANVLKKQKGEKTDDMEEEGSVNAPENPDDAVKKAMVESEKAAQDANKANKPAGAKAPTATTTAPPKKCEDETKNDWICKKAKDQGCPSEFAKKYCRKTCGVCKPGEKTKAE